jgi:hypothetical protein
MRLNKERLLGLWNLEDMPACDAGTQQVEAFLVSCSEAVDSVGEEGPEDRLRKGTFCWSITAIYVMTSMKPTVI